MTVDAFRAASEAAKTVWQDLVTADPQPGPEERLDAVLDAYTAALAEAGCLIVPALAPTTDELDETAKWLAVRSAFPRYTDGDGWRLLRNHPRDVEVAYAKARANTGQGEEDLLHALTAARRVLLNACTDAVAGTR